MTTMCSFTMCEDCAKEYLDPKDRRFHAQPVACAVCGPEVTSLISADNKWKNSEKGENAVREAAEVICNGGIALIQGIGGFHLACDALNDTAVLELRKRKHREAKPLAVMFPAIETVKQYCNVSEAEQSLLLSSKAPIVLLEKKSVCPIAPAVAPHNPALGCMIAYSPLHKMLFSKCGVPLVMTSANYSEEPIAYKVDDAKKRMQGIADIALVHNREIHMFADDSVARVVNGSRRVWRRSRGYVPEPILVPEGFAKQTLAFGPQMKNTFCLGRNNSALLSQHMGDLENEHALNAQKKALDHFLSVFHAQPELIACDLHPDYASTRLAETYSTEHYLPLVHVQHHHAHHVACLTENGVTEEAIGLALDGTGYGTDGTIWGGEILIGDARQFTRAGYLYPVPLLGGERAVKEPWRMALSWLYECFDEDALDLPIEFMEKLKSNISRESLPVLLNPNLLEHTFPRTSSLGRLFDAVSALTFFGMQKQFEGQAAMNLEWMLPATIEKPYPFDILEREGALVLSPMPMVLNLVDDLRDGVDLPVISMRFHEGVVDGFIRVCEKVRAVHGLTTVTLSGGCFQNAYLQTRFEERLSQLKFRVLTHHQVPTNDGGVSLGQAVIANAKKEQ